MILRPDITVVGAGAAGLMAAIFAARASPRLRVVALDGAKKIGAKILISGGGRCNVTHDVVHARDFNGNRNAIARVLKTFDVPATIEFFREAGVELKREETGKLFPVTDSARTVIEALLVTLADAGAEVLPGHRVETVERAQDGRFIINGTTETKVLILATGGRSVPKTGSDGHGYAIARSLGHTVSDVFPALVPLVIDGDHWIKSLSGVSVEAELSVTSGTGRVLHRERGSLLFTHFGLSGPLALDISRHWIAARTTDPGAGLVANLLPGETFESLEEAVVAESRRNAHATFASQLRGWLPERLLDVLVRDAQPLGRLTREDRRRLIVSLVSLPLPVSRDRGFDYAEVTAGGVPLNEVDVSTMASRRCPGLYLCGEILDVDGKIGGYNFQWAWASGRLAGMHAAYSIDSTRPR